jgi:hypothetical protein
MTLSHSDASELAQLLEGTTAGALIPEIVRGVFRTSWSAAASGQGTRSGGGINLKPIAPQ